MLLFKYKLFFECLIKWLLAISGYCKLAIAPTLTYSTSVTPLTTVGSTTSVTCLDGYGSSGGIVAPYYICGPLATTAGVWSTVQYSCGRIIDYTLYYSDKIKYSVNHVSFIKSKCIFLLEIQTYCQMPPPEISSAVMANLALDQTINGWNNFTCLDGYVSSGGSSTTPYFTCLDYNATVGIWSSVTYSCVRMILLLIK